MVKLPSMQPMPFVKIAGKSVYRPPIMAHLQVDASYKHHMPDATRCGLILKSASRRLIYQEVLQLGRVQNATEAEWAGLHAAVEFAVEQNELTVEAENDNLGVISVLITRNYPTRHKYANYYYKRIFELGSQMEWLGVRWIPRSINYADDLLR
jgi:hypothetical protein